MSSRVGRQGWGVGLAVMVIALVVVPLYLFSPEAAREERGPRMLALPTQFVQYRSVRIPVHSRGVVRSSRRIPLVSEVGGRVVSVADAFRDGGFVQEGKVLMQLEEQGFRRDIARQRNKLRAAELHLAKTRANAQVARNNNTRTSDFARFEPQLAEAKSRVAAARAGLDSARRRLRKATLRAPFTGRVEKVAVQSGQYVQPGMKLARLYSTRDLVVRLPVQDEWLPLLGLPVDPGAATPPLRVELRARFAGRAGQWRGELVRREGGLNANQMVFLVVRVGEAKKETTPSLEPGVFVQAELTGEAYKGVAVLPRSAMAGQDSVWVLDQDQRLRRRKVDVLYRDEQSLYVRGGLDAPARVVKASGMRLLEGTRVQPLGAMANALGHHARREAETPDVAQH